MSRVVFFFADGLEECEGLIPVDLMRRAGIHVDIAAVGEASIIVGSHGIRIVCDKLARDVDSSEYDCVMLPGGLPGTDNLAASEKVRDVCREMDAEGKLVCAICAAPGALAGFGVLEGQKASVYPGREHFLAEGGAECTGQQVTIDANNITGEALGAAFKFAFEVIAALEGREVSDRVRNAIVYKD